MRRACSTVDFQICHAVSDMHNDPPGSGKLVEEDNGSEGRPCGTSGTSEAAVVEPAQQAGVAVDTWHTGEQQPADGASSALQRAAKLTEANAALKRSLDVLASETDVDRLLAHILGEVGGRLAAQRIVLWLAEGEQAPAISPRLCWAEQ